MARHEAKDGTTTLISMKGKSVFTSNEAKNGFGGAIINQADLILIGNQTFSNNIAAYGGALANLLGLEKTSTLLGGESTFTSNSASWGGAIFNQSNLFIVGNQTFDRNSGKYGSAIANYTKDAKVFISDEATFLRNSACYGEAIYN